MCIRDSCIDGKLFRGQNQKAGEFGHMILVPGGRKCYCGKSEMCIRDRLERIREIRASERMFYQKITELYATAIDYDKEVCGLSLIHILYIYIYRRVGS